MQWSKIKTIILLILVMVNAFLLVMTGVQEFRSARYQQEARTEAAAVLEKNGITFLPEEIPPGMKLAPLEVTWDRMGENEDGMAQALLGEAVRRDRDGELQATYTSELGSADFYSSGRFLFRLEPGAVPLNGETPQRHAARCLELLSFDGEPAGVAQEGSVTVVTFLQRWAGSPIFSCKAVLTYEEDELRAIDAQRISGASAPAEGTGTLSTASVLIRFLAGIHDGQVSVCNEIRAMTQGYQANLSRPVTSLTPVWRIVTDTGAYYLDAATGAITPEL